MNNSKAWFVASLFLPINAIRIMVFNVTNSARSIWLSWRSVRDRLRMTPPKPLESLPGVTMQLDRKNGKVHVNIGAQVIRLNGEPEILEWAARNEVSDSDQRRLLELCARHREVADESKAGERFSAAAARHSLDSVRLLFIQEYMRKRKRAGIVMFYLSFGSLLMTLLAWRPYLAFCALIFLVACWTLAFVNAFHEQQIREKKLFSISLYLKKNGYFHPLNWN